MDYPDTIKLTVTQRHLDLAIEAEKTHRYVISKQCVVAQAVLEVFPGQELDVAMRGFSLANMFCYLDTSGRMEFITLNSWSSDLSKGSPKLREHLPITLTFKRDTSK